MQGAHRLGLGLRRVGARVCRGPCRRAGRARRVPPSLAHTARSPGLTASACGPKPAKSGTLRSRVAGLLSLPSPAARQVRGVGTDCVVGQLWRSPRSIPTERRGPADARAPAARWAPMLWKRGESIARRAGPRRSCLLLGVGLVLSVLLIIFFLLRLRLITSRGASAVLDAGFAGLRMDCNRGFTRPLGLLRLCK